MSSNEESFFDFSKCPEFMASENQTRQGIETVAGIMERFIQQGKADNAAAMGEQAYKQARHLAWVHAKTPVLLGDGTALVDYIHANATELRAERVATTRDYGLLTGVTGRVAASVRRIRYDDESHRSGVDMGMVDVVTLMVTRRLASLPNAQRAGEFAGDILSVTVGHDGWIEYDHKSYQGHTAPELANHWLREHHWMLILSVTPSPTEEPAGWGRMHG